MTMPGTTVGNGAVVAQTGRGTCAVCTRAAVEEFLDLGSTALATRFLAREELTRPEPAYPLRVGFCRACGHVQLTEIVPPVLMFVVPS